MQHPHKMLECVNNGSKYLVKIGIIRNLKVEF